MFILTQFIFRLSFGLALGMALTSPRQVTSGYFRNHLYVLLGLNVLATLVAIGSQGQLWVAPPLAAATLAYLGSVFWLYEKPRMGIAALVLISAVTLCGAWAATPGPPAAGLVGNIFDAVDPLTGGLVLGMTMAAMFLGHWYLNTPTMALGPLRKLILLMGAAVCLRGVVEGWGLALQGIDFGWPPTEKSLFITLRWLSGILGAFGLSVMAWQTLKIPNTQSATGILYVAVIATFLGELTSMLAAAPHTTYL